jgi:NADP-dependent 3-hydroxy acid dehydrogenase YdfG
MNGVGGQVFIVTGGGGAIARPILHAFAGAGARLAIVDRTLEHAGPGAAAVKGLPVAADLATPSGAEQMVKTVEAHLGPVDGLIHTVGGFAMGKIAEVEVAQYDRMFDANVRTLFHAARSVLPGMIARNRGFFAGFSSEPAHSMAGAAPGAALYAASKAAVATFLRSLDAELTGSQVRIAIVYPMGAVDTPANRRDMPGFDPARYIDPEDIAATLLHAATRSPRARLPELAVYPAR